MANKNRKKSETYRFNGYPHKNPKSIHSVTISDLKSYIDAFTKKLADPDDADDKRWTKRWLERFKRELAKKQKGLALKKREK
jgi:hypothetical protein